MKANRLGPKRRHCRPLRQLTEQRLRLLQIERVKPFRKPAIDRSEQFARLLRLTLVAPETGILRAMGQSDFGCVHAVNL